MGCWEMVSLNHSSVGILTISTQWLAWSLRDMLTWRPWNCEVPSFHANTAGTLPPKPKSWSRVVNLNIWSQDELHELIFSSTLTSKFGPHWLIVVKRLLNVGSRGRDPMSWRPSVIFHKQDKYQICLEQLHRQFFSNPNQFWPKLIYTNQTNQS